MKGAAVLIVVAACGFSPHGPPNHTVDGGPADASDAEPMPVTCGDLTCDPHATCVTTSADATCACASGYSGDGFTCTDIDECATNTLGCLAACQNTDGSAVCYAPVSCADLAAHGVTVDNSNHTLYLDGDPAKPYPVFCAGTGANAKEYLSLTGMNQAIYVAGGASPGTDVKTTFTKIRFVADQHKVDISDRAFATSTGMLNHSGDGVMVTKLPYGVAMECKGSGSMTATAHVDLSGTHFAFSGGAAFAGGGSGFAADTMLVMANQQGTVKGGGNCGWNAPAGAPSNPFNDNVTSANGLLLTLVYH